MNINYFKLLILIICIFSQTRLNSQYELWCLGSNSNGQFGFYDGTNVYTSFVKSPNFKFKKISPPFAIDENSKLWILGKNSFCSIDSNRGNYFCQIGLDSDWKDIYYGGFSGLLLKNNGTLWGIGSNSFGQLGIPDIKITDLPVQVGNDKDWNYIYTKNYKSMAIKVDGSLWAWGQFDDLHLFANGDSTSSKYPQKIDTALNWKTIVINNNLDIFGIKRDSTLWTILQTGVPNYKYNIVHYQKDSNNVWVKLSAGETHTLALKSNGDVWGWGWNESKQLGFDSTIYRGNHNPIYINFKIKDIACGDWSSFLLTEKGEILYSGIMSTLSPSSFFAKIDSLNQFETLSSFNSIKGECLFALRDLTTEVDYQSLSKGTNLIKSFQQNNSTGDISINIDSQTNQTANIRIIDILGNELLTISNKNLIVGDNQINISIQNLYSGFYILNITTDYQSQIVKFVK